MALFKAIAVVGGYTGLSRVTGFVRDVLIARFLGAGIAADAFFVALKIPNLFRSLFAEGAFNAAFVPLFAEQLEGKGKEKAKEFAKDTFSALLYIVAMFVAVAEVCMPLLVIMVAPGFLEDEGKVELTAQMCRITFPFLLLVSLNSMQGGVLNTMGKFAAPAFTSTILNLTMIAALFGLTPFVKGGAAFALCWGVLIAGFVQFVFLAWHLRRQDMLLHLKAPAKVLLHASREAKLLLKRILPGVAGAGIYQINLIIDTFFVSFVGAGAVSWLYYANRLFQLPVGLLGAAIGTALLPLLSRQIKANNKKGEKDSLGKSVELAFLVSMPAAVGLFILDVPIMAALFQYGEFNAETTIMAASALAAFAIGLPAYVVSKSLLPAFFARGDTKSPVRVAGIALVLNAFLCFVLMQKMGHVGIALATSITAWINLYQYYFMLRRRGFLPIRQGLWQRLLRIVFCSLAMGFALWFALLWVNGAVDGWTSKGAEVRVAILAGLVLFGGAVYAGVGSAVGLRKVFK